MKSLSIIGCGKVGKVFGRLFHEAGLFEIREILNRTIESGQEAADFIGAGRPVITYEEMDFADLFLIAASDDAIAPCADALAASGLAAPGVVVWHLSGSLPSTVLGPVKKMGAVAASVHPVRSFADPAASVTEFAGTWCGIEGDDGAVALLTGAFETVGGRIFQIDREFKTVYHAGSVLVCNYLTALIEAGVRCYDRAGLSREKALQVIEPLVRGTVDNVFRAGTEAALTGPIARGDATVVSTQLEALQLWDADVASIYRSLGRVALDLARKKDKGDAGSFDAITDLLAE